MGYRSVWAVTLAFVLILQIATYNPYNEIFPSTDAYSASITPEDLIGKGYTYDFSITLPNAFAIDPSPGPIVVPKVITSVTISTDKTSYTIGEKVVVNVTVSPVKTDQKVTISIFTPQNIQGTFSKSPDANGKASISFTLPDKAPTGTWKAVAEYLDKKAEVEFTVSKKITADMPPVIIPASVSISTDKTSYNLAEEVIINIGVLPVKTDTQIVVSIFNPQKLHEKFSKFPDQTGKAIFSFTLPDEAPTGTWKIIAQYLDAQATVELSVTKKLSVDPTPVVTPEKITDKIGLQKITALNKLYVPGEVLIGLKSGASWETVQSMIQQAGGDRKITALIDKINLLRIGVDEKKEDEFIAKLLEFPAAQNLVTFAVKNKYLVPTATEVTDPGYLSWQLDHYQLINLPNAWSVTMGRSEVLVAVIDSGIDFRHPDFSNIWRNDGDCDNDGKDNDGNGFEDDCNAVNFAEPDTPNSSTGDDGGSWPMCDGHGTHVSGIIGAASNGIGSVGVAPYTTIMPIKVFENKDDGDKMVCTTDQVGIAQAIIYAADNGARIINLSVGCSGEEKCDKEEFQSVGRAFEYAFNKGALIVAAAGNDSDHTERIEAVNDWLDFGEYVLEVSSISMDGSLADYSNSGPGVNLSAPGTNVYSTKLGGAYGIKSGTSQATPMVAGCAALLLSVNESLTNRDLERILIDNAKEIGYSYGLLDCSKALGSIVTLASEEQTEEEAMTQEQASEEE
ncbi:MAG: S8 family serine peptidase, partial [Nitrososphaerales archaeon]